MRSTTMPTLYERMRALADTGHPHAAELRRLADILEVDIKASFVKEDATTVRRMLSSWARARRCWCEATGDPLV